MLTPWNTPSLRATIIRSTFDAEPPESRWASILGSEPEAITRQPHAGIVEEHGPALGGRLGCISMQQRTDWVLQANEDQTGISSIVGDVDLDAFTAFIRERVLPTEQSVARLAFGVVLQQLAENREDGYRRLAAYLPKVEIDPLGSSDFTYQINRRRPSRRVAGLEINRLNKWLVSQQFVLVASAPALLATPTLVTLRAELDVNSSPEWTSTFAPAKLAELWDELVENACELAASGDIA